MKSECHQTLSSHTGDGDNVVEILTKKWGWYNQDGSFTCSKDGEPAYVRYKNGIESYCAYIINDKCHRIDGPAIICVDSTVLGHRENQPFERYFILDYSVSKEDFYTPGFIDAFILEHS